MLLHYFNYSVCPQPTRINMNICSGQKFNLHFLPPIFENFDSLKDLLESSSVSLSGPIVNFGTLSLSPVVSGTSCRPFCPLELTRRGGLKFALSASLPPTLYSGPFDI